MRAVVYHAPGRISLDEVADPRIEQPADAVAAVANAGSIGIAGVYPPGFSSYPIGAAMNKNLTIRMGNCNHRRYLPRLLDPVASGVVRPTEFITQTGTPEDASAPTRASISAPTAGSRRSSPSRAGERRGRCWT